MVVKNAGLNGFLGHVYINQCSKYIKEIENLRTATLLVIVPRDSHVEEESKT